jgi:hypothetical protein
MSPRKIDNRRRAADFIQGSLYNHGQHTKVSIIWSYFDGCICSRDVDPTGTGIRMDRAGSGGGNTLATLNNCEFQKEKKIVLVQAKILGRKPAQNIP